MKVNSLNLGKRNDGYVCVCVCVCVCVVVCVLCVWMRHGVWCVGKVYYANYRTW